jgi:hypothetical protein
VEVDPEVKDHLRADNTRYLAATVLDRIATLIVDGAPGREGFLDSATGYLKLALDPTFGSASASDPLFAIEEGFDHDLALKVFADYDWITLANLREIPEAKARELVRAVRSGTGLLLFLGNRIEPDLYNDRLFGPGEDRLLPGRLLEPRVFLDRETVFDLEIHDFRHPVLRFFADETIRPLLTEYPKTLGFVGYDPGTVEKGLRVLARFSDPDRSPALVEWGLGAGHVLLVTTSASDTWTTLPRTPGYLPLIQEIGTYLAGEDPGRRNLDAGVPLALEISRFSPNPWIEMPSGERRRIEMQSIDEEKGRFLLAFEETREPGIYRIGGLSARPGPDEEGGHRFVFATNTRPEEGDLRRISEGEVRGLYPEFDFRWREDYARESEVRESRREGEIWKYLLGAVLALLLLEGFLAQFFGDYTKR